MFSTVIIAILLVSALYCLIRGGTTFGGEPGASIDDGPYVPRRLVGVILLVPAVIWAVIVCVTVVQAKQVGVLTTFGKPNDRTLNSGLHFKAPWQKVTQIDATVQSDEYRGDDCITVRLGDGNTACVSTTNRWRVVQSQADTIYSDYRSDDPTESLRDAVVSTVFKAAVNSTFGKYDPTAALNDVDTSDPNAVKSINFSPDYDGLAQDVEDSMNARLAKRGEPLVEIDTVTISYLKLNEKTQAKIDAFQAEIAKTQIALQSVLTNQAKADANRVLADSLAQNPNVLVDKCLDLIDDDAFTPPAGFTCWPGGNGAVIVPSAGAK